MQPSPMTETSRPLFPSVCFCIFELLTEARSRFSLQSTPVLFVADLFHPVYGFPIQRFLNGDMRHRRRGRRPMPMLLAGRKLDHITGPNFLDWPALALNPTQAECDNQSLAEWMRMPGGAGTWFECDAAAADTRRIGCLEQRVHTDRAGEIFRGSLAGRRRTAAFDLHG